MNTDFKVAISVVVPVYNSEEYLPKCIESILNQSFSDFELILIDDGSSDGSGRICDGYARKDDRVRVIHKRNEGVSAARNDGIDAAKGKYLSFVDSDDYIESTFLESALADVEKSGAEVYISGLQMETCRDGKVLDAVKYCIKESKVFSVKELLEALNTVYPQICICGPWCKLYTAAVIKQNNIRFLKDLNCGEDTYFNLCVLEKTEKVFFSANWFYHYCRSNEESLFGRFHPDTYEIHTFIYDRMRELMNAHVCSTEAMTRFENMYFSMLVGGIHEYYRFSDKTTKQERLLQIKKVAGNLYVGNLKSAGIMSNRSKVILLLLKVRANSIIACIFEVYYRMRYGK